MSEENPFASVYYYRIEIKAFDHHYLPENPADPDSPSYDAGPYLLAVTSDSANNRNTLLANGNDFKAFQALMHRITMEIGIHQFDLKVVDARE